MELVNVTRRFKPEQYELAQAGYEAYKAWTGGRSVVTGDVLPEFGVLLPKVQDAWAAAGEAVEKTVLQALGIPGRAEGWDEDVDRDEGWDKDVETRSEG